MSRRRFSMHPARPCVDAQGRRLCTACGDFIDPVDWCPRCREAGAACGQPHLRLRKRADARFCDAGCKAWHRASFERDCL